MPIARGLTDTKGDRECVFVRRVAEISRVIKSGKYATTADERGAIGAWIDDKGKMRCEAMRHLHTIDSQIFKTLKEVKGWYAEWMKKIA